MLRRVVAAALMGGALLVVPAGYLTAATRTVEKPMFNGNRLDWCANWGADCGKPAAEAWCLAQGFAGVDKFSKDPRIGASSPTRLIATGAICDEPKCHGFAEITCVKLDTVQPRSTVASAEPALPDPPASEPAEPETVVAVEVERIAEAQRYMAKLLNERALGAGEAQPTHARGHADPVERR